MIIRINPEKCTGCRACEVFCSLGKENTAKPNLSRVQVLKDMPNNIILPILCLPCNENPCMNACPEPGAMVVDSHTGAVQIVEELCTACSKCITACEIGAIQFLRMDGRGKNKKAVVIKCDQCGGDPWCVKVCEPGALEYIEDHTEDEGQIIYNDLKSALENSGFHIKKRGRKKSQKRETK